MTDVSTLAEPVGGATVCVMTDVKLFPCAVFFTIVKVMHCGISNGGMFLNLFSHASVHNIR